jgi:hypothetical protein
MHHFVFATFVIATSAVTFCVDDLGHSSDNLCIDSEDGPNCMNRGTEAIPSWECATCAVNCDCPIGHYCVKTPGPDAGTCVSLASRDRIGGSCIDFDVVHTPTRGVDELLLCGEPIFAISTTDARFLGYEWLGACIGGTCRECAGDLVTTGVVTAKTVISTDTRTTPVVVVADNFTLRDGGSLICGDRYCNHGKIVAETTVFEDYFWTGTLVGILIVLCMMLGLFVTMSIVDCSSRRKDRRVLSRVFHQRMPVYIGKTVHFQRLNVVSGGEDE